MARDHDSTQPPLFDLPHPLGMVRQLTVFRCWLDGMHRSGAVGVPAIDEEEAAHRLAEFLCQRYGVQPLSICVEACNVITIFDVTPRRATVYDVERRTQP